MIPAGFDFPFYSSKLDLEKVDKEYKIEKAFFFIRL